MVYKFFISAFPFKLVQFTEIAWKKLKEKVFYIAIAIIEKRQHVPLEFLLEFCLFWRSYLFPLFLSLFLVFDCLYSYILMLLPLIAFTVLDDSSKL